jgi:hypothetical protein
VLAKILKHGSGSGSRALDYLLSDLDHTRERRENPPELLRGDPETAATLIDSLSFAQRYTSGVLSFTEDEAQFLENCPDLRFEMINSFERDFLVPGMDIDRLSMVWIQHRDHNRTELHFVVANVDLETGKRFPAYFDKADRARLASWQDVQNLSHGLDDPRDPERRRAVDHAKKLPGNKAELAETLEKLVAQKCVRGELADREAIVEFIRAKGLEVGRQGKDYITVLCGEGKNDRFRLKGELFSESFRFDRSIAAGGGRDDRDRQADADRRTREAQERLGAAVQRRREYLEKRFGDSARIDEERRERERRRDERAARQGKSGRDVLAAEVLLGSQGGSHAADRNDDAALRAGRTGDMGMDASGTVERPHVTPEHGRWAAVSGDRGSTVDEMQHQSGLQKSNLQTVQDHRTGTGKVGEKNELDTQRSGSPLARFLAAVANGVRGAREAFDRTVHALHDRARTAIHGARRSLSALDRAVQRNDGNISQHRQTAQIFDVLYRKVVGRIQVREELERTREISKEISKGRDFSK